MSWNPAPFLNGANWAGNTQLATKNQLISSVSGLYLDIQDINLSSITVNNLNVSTLTAQTFISTPELYVSSIIGGGIQVNNGLLQISTGDFSFVSLSTLSFKGIDLGGVSFNFDLGLGNAIGGFLGGLGALVGGVFIGLGTGVGLGIQGITNGLFSLANTQGGTQINNTVFETINGSTQLQISTLGNAYPLYSSIFRSVSSISPNQVPGQEVFLSTFFQPGTTAIRSVSDPLPLLTNDSNINTSTIQSFGEWIPFYDPSVAGEDISARNAQFSSLKIANSNLTLNPILIQTSNTTGIAQILNLINTPNTAINCNIVYSDSAYSLSQREGLYANATTFNGDVSFISTPYTQYTSTIGNYVGGVLFLDSTITNQSTIPKFIYIGNILGGANFAVCEPDESGFISSYTMDIVAQSCNVFLQWGLAVNNLNSTIAQGTAKRVSWNIPANNSNFIDIPVPPSTIKTLANSATYLYQRPLECFWDGAYSGANPQGGMAFSMNRMTFGADTTFNNIPGYPYQFNNNLYVNGIVEADTLIATSSILAVSTNIQTFFSTQTFEADQATISSAIINYTTASNVDSVYIEVSTLYSTDLIGANSISTFGIENYSHLSQFSFVSTLVVDLQILEGTNGNTTCYLNNITSNIPGSRIAMGRGTFQSLSTINTSTGNITANIASIPTINTNSLSTSLLTGSNAFIPNFYGDNLYGEFLTVSTATTSTLNVNTISTTSHSGSDITCDNITINDFATFPSVGNNSNAITMTLSNTNNSNAYTCLQANTIEGSVFPQTSNQFTITTTGSNTTINDNQELILTTTIGSNLTFGGSIDQIVAEDADLSVRAVKYGTLAGGYLQPRAFRQQTSGSFSANQSLNVNVQVSDGTNTFLHDDYNLMTSLASFYVDNSAIAWNEMILAPFSSNNNWWVNITGRVNAASSEDWTISWNNLLFPYNMMT